MTGRIRLRVATKGNNLLAEGSFELILSELRGDDIHLLARDERDRRLSLQIPCDLLEEIPPPPAVELYPVGQKTRTTEPAPQRQAS